MAGLPTGIDPSGFHHITRSAGDPDLSQIRGFPSSLEGPIIFPDKASEATVLLEHTSPLAYCLSPRP
jgi:hypothetical protein